MKEGNINNIGKVTTELVDGKFYATINPHTLTIKQLTKLLEDEKCTGVEGVIVNGCMVNFKRINF